MRVIFIPIRIRYASLWKCGGGTPMLYVLYLLNATSCFVFLFKKKQNKVHVTFAYTIQYTAYEIIRDDFYINCLRRGTQGRANGGE